MYQHKIVLKLLLLIAVLWLASVLMNRFPPYDPLQISLVDKLLPPSGEHICGTDELGRDIFSRMLVGFSNTVTVAFMAFLSSFLLGTLFGSLAGYYYLTWVDKIFNWVCALIFSLPFLLTISAAMSLMEKSLLNSYLILTCIIWVAPARIVRAGIVKVKSEKFVLAERALGYPEQKILIRTLLPASVGPSFLFSFKYLPELIGLEAGLSFLGLGVQPPNPGLGKMIFDSLNYLYSAWWYAFFPSLLLFLLVLSLNLFLKDVYR